MKQKLLNSFTWRGTLLVALLSCAFSSAWGQGQTDPTATLTFSSNVTSVTADDVTWEISDGNYSNNEWSGSNFSLTATSSITGKITKVVVHAKSSQKNKAKITLTVGTANPYTNTNFSDTNYSDHEISVNQEVTGESQIVVNLARTGGNASVTVDKIIVYYESNPKFSISDACHGIADEEGNVRNFGTYSYDCPFKVPAAGDNDVKVFTIDVNGDALTLNQLPAYTIVPANTGVLVSATAGGTYAAVPTLASGTALQNNMLVASSVDMSGNNLFYHLTMNGDDIGFYWGAANGVAWTFSGTNKAYLAIPSSNSNSIKGFSFTDTTNGIKTVEATENESSVIYNLAGQRVSKMQKGIYVVNGKKMLVK